MTAIPVPVGNYFLTETAELLLLVGRLVQADGYEGELSSSQWMALHFFARANSFSRTLSTNQLALTHDIRNMPTESFLKLLPEEFSARW